MEFGDNAFSAPVRGHPHPLALHDWLQVMSEEYFGAGCCLIDLDKLRVSISFVENRKQFLMESKRKCDEGLPQAGCLSSQF